MALDKLVDSTQLDSDLTSVADAIRTKGGTSASLAFPADFVTAINAISGGGAGDSGALITGYQEYHWDTVTIGANSIRSTLDLVNYLSAAVGADASAGEKMARFYFGMVNPPTPYYNMISCKALSGNSYASSVMRYRNGAFSNASIAPSYDASVQANTTYIVAWVVEVSQ